MAAHVLHQGLACCGSTAWAHRRGGLRRASRAVGVRVGVGVGVWACERVGGWRSWVVVDSGAAPDETQPATRAKRAETDNSDEAPIWANHGASRPRITGLFLLT